MARTTLTVYALHLYRNGKDRRCVVACINRGVAAALFKCSYRHMLEYGSISGNQQEVTAAMAQPGHVITSPLDDRE